MLNRAQRFLIAAFLFLLLAPGTSRAQGVAADYQRANTIAQTLNGPTSCVNDMLVKGL